MTNETKLKGGLVLSLLTLLWLMVMWSNENITVRTQNKTIDSLNRTNELLSIERDSLYQEYFNSEVMNGRYEITLEHLKLVNPKAVKQFTDYMYNETE